MIAFLSTSWSSVGLVALSATLMLLAIVVVMRVAGLRSFSKMSSFDSVTVSFGSLLAGVALSGSSLINGVVAAATLIGVQILIALGRSRLGLDGTVASWVSAPALPDARDRRCWGEAGG